MAERVIAVGRRRAQEDEVEQALQAAGGAQAGEQFGEVARERLGGASQGLQTAEQRLDRRQRRPGDLSGLAQALEEPRGAVGEGRQVRERLVDPGRGDFQVGEHRGRLVGEAPEAFHRRSELFQERREVGQVAFQRAAMAGGRLRDRVALHDEVGDPRLRTAANGAKGLSESTASLASTWFSLARIASTLSSSCKRRVGAADDRVQIASAPGQARAELVDDDRQALALGQARDVAEQVDVDRAVGVLHRQQSLARAFLAGGDLAQGRRQRRAFDARLGRQAVDELLADQRLGANRCSWRRRGSP